MIVVDSQQSGWQTSGLTAGSRDIEIFLSSEEQPDIQGTSILPKYTQEIIPETDASSHLFNCTAQLDSQGDWSSLIGSELPSSEEPPGSTGTSLLGQLDGNIGPDALKSSAQVALPHKKDTLQEATLEAAKCADRPSKRQKISAVTEMRISKGSERSQGKELKADQTCTNQDRPEIAQPTADSREGDRQPSIPKEKQTQTDDWKFAVELGASRQRRTRSKPATFLLGPCSKCKTKSSKKWYPGPTSHSCICDRCYIRPLPGETFGNRSVDSWNAENARDCTSTIRRLAGDSEASILSICKGFAKRPDFRPRSHSHGVRNQVGHRNKKNGSKRVSVGCDLLPLKTAEEEKSTGPYINSSCAQTLGPAKILVSPGQEDNAKLDEFPAHKPAGVSSQINKPAKVGRESFSGMILNGSHTGLMYDKPILASCVLNKGIQLGIARSINSALPTCQSFGSDTFTGCNAHLQAVQHGPAISFQPKVPQPQASAPARNISNFCVHKPAILDVNSSRQRTMPNGVDSKPSALTEMLQHLPKDMPVSQLHKATVQAGVRKRKKARAEKDRIGSDKRASEATNALKNESQSQSALSESSDCSRSVPKSQKSRFWRQILYKCPRGFHPDLNLTMEDLVERGRRKMVNSQIHQYSTECRLAEAKRNQS